MPWAVVHTCKLRRPRQEDLDFKPTLGYVARLLPKGTEKSAVLYYIVYREFRTMHTFLLRGIVKRTLDDFMTCIFTFIAKFLFTLGKRSFSANFVFLQI